jgi:CO/xanthine dehydrogenase FAD-binding subunit
MRSFEYVRASDVGHALALMTGHPEAAYLAGGTTQLDLMKDGVWHPDRLVDVTRLPLGEISPAGGSLRIGAAVTMEELASSPALDELPFVREALRLGASVQLRNMATIGGNLLQRTRCRYYRDPTVAACNKRAPGSGCAALTGFNRGHAVLGASENCIATHASDLAVPLMAMDAVVHVQGPDSRRSVPIGEFYRLPGDTPHLENVLQHGELITEVEVGLLPPGARSTYLKVRDRHSYEFALASAAVALTVERGTIGYCRIALGGVATAPWRAAEAEQVLRGAPATADTFAEAATAALRGAVPRRDNAYKVELAKRTMVRALQEVSGVDA